MYFLSYLYILDKKLNADFLLIKQYFKKHSQKVSVFYCF